MRDTLNQPSKRQQIVLVSIVKTVKVSSGSHFFSKFPLCFPLDSVSSLRIGEGIIKRRRRRKKKEFAKKKKRIVNLEDTELICQSQIAKASY